MKLLLGIFSIAGLLGQEARPADLKTRLTQAPALSVRRVDLPTSSTHLYGISAVAGDQAGHLYVIHRPPTGDPIVVLDRQGRVLRSWGRGMFTLPHGIRVDPAGNVWTVDAATSIVYKFDRLGSKLLQIDVGNVPKESCGVAPTAVGATDVAFGAGGQVFVTDGYCNGRVLQFDAAGRKLAEWGTRGSGPGAFLVAHSVAVSAQGRIFVADRENGRVHRFDPSGSHLGVWHYGPQVFSLAFNRAGNLFMSVRATGAAETDMHIVQINPEDGAILGVVGVRSHEIGVAPDGALLPGTRNGQVTIFVPGR